MNLDAPRGAGANIIVHPWKHFVSPLFLLPILYKTKCDRFCNTGADKHLKTVTQTSEGGSRTITIGESNVKGTFKSIHAY